MIFVIVILMIVKLIFWYLVFYFLPFLELINFYDNHLLIIITTWIYPMDSFYFVRIKECRFDTIYAYPLKINHHQNDIEIPFNHTNVIHVYSTNINDDIVDKLLWNNQKPILNV